MRLGIDLDGVVVDFSAHYRDTYRRAFGGELVPPELTRSWKMDIGHFPDEAALWAWLSTTDFWVDPPVYDGALEALADLAGDGFELVVVTHKPEWAQARTLEWVRRVDLACAETIFARDKTQVAADLFVDDGPHNLEAFAAAGKPAARLVQPWNRPVPGIVDVSSLDDFADLARTRRDALRAA